MAHKKAHEHEPTDAELKEQFAESMDAEIDKQVEKTENQRMTSSTTPSDLSEEDYWRLKIAT